jgi:tetratricopeptide (TPR) repeat protein
LVFPILLALWFIGGGKKDDKDKAAALLSQSLEDAKTDRYGECVSAAVQAFRLDSGLAEAYLNAGWCQAKLGRWDDAIGNTQQALRLRPDLQMARNNLNWMLQQKRGSSQPSAPPAVLPPSPAADSALTLSLQHAQGHRYPECAEAARKAIELKPDMPEAYNNLGFCTANMGKLDEAIGELREALRLKPDFQLANNNLNWVLSEKAKAGGRAGGK